jgi:hypothetical protein
MEYGEKKCDYMAVLKLVTTGVVLMREKEIRIVRRKK